jgi:hypothetical protein
VKKEVREILKKAEKQGWRIDQGKEHTKAYSPDGVTIVAVANTPGGGRWKQNLIAELKRGGFEE